jgi:hypothetical protein
MTPTSQRGQKMYMVMLLIFPLLPILLLIAQAEKDIKIDREDREMKSMYMSMLLIFPLLPILLHITQTEKDTKIERG